MLLRCLLGGWNELSCGNKKDYHRVIIWMQSALFLFCRSALPCESREAIREQIVALIHTAFEALWAKFTWKFYVFSLRASVFIFFLLLDARHLREKRKVKPPSAHTCGVLRRVVCYWVGWITDAVCFSIWKRWSLAKYRSFWECGTGWSRECGWTFCLLWCWLEPVCGGIRTSAFVHF